jgi:hypothetical protein
MTPGLAVLLVVLLALVLAIFALLSVLDQRREDRRRRGGGFPPGLAALLLLSVVLTACVGAGSVVPTLGAIIGRVDVPRLLECASRSGMDRARCLGASVLTTALDVAVDKAADLAERAKDAANKGAGADDMTDAERSELALDLDQALDKVGVEVAAAQ